MRFELYQKETARIAAEQSALLAQARAALQQKATLNSLEQAGVLHALQILIENAIGKAKQLLHAKQYVVPVSGYDAFKALATFGLMQPQELTEWNAIIGLRNRIVHDYMNIDIDLVIGMIVQNKEQFVVDFLLKEFY
jgi:uncharacterized protein YutE (UPF0331/DUF86 family)